MAEPFTKPTEDSAKKDGEKVEIGENLDFQRKWWMFERIIWSFFVLVIVCDLLGMFGRGWLAKAQRTTPDGALVLKYERIERTSTPSIMTLQFSPAAIKKGRIQVFVSDSVVKGLGAQRVSPQPTVSAVGNERITYQFAATQGVADVQIEMDPSHPGTQKFRVQLMGEAPIEASVFVMP